MPGPSCPSAAVASTAERLTLFAKTKPMIAPTNRPITPNNRFSSFIYLIVMPIDSRNLFGRSPPMSANT